MNKTNKTFNYKELTRLSYLMKTCTELGEHEDAVWGKWGKVGIDYDFIKKTDGNIFDYLCEFSSKDNEGCKMTFEKEDLVSFRKMADESIYLLECIDKDGEWNDYDLDYEYAKKLFAELDGLLNEEKNKISD